MHLYFHTLWEQEGTLSMANSSALQMANSIGYSRFSREGSMRDVVETFPLPTIYCVRDTLFRKDLQAYFFPLILTTILEINRICFPR